MKPHRTKRGLTTETDVGHWLRSISVEFEEYDPDDYMYVSAIGCKWTYEEAGILSECRFSPRSVSVCFTI